MRATWLTGLVFVTTMACRPADDGRGTGDATGSTGEVGTSWDASSGGGGTGDDGPGGAEPFVPGQQVLPRLTELQYRNTVTDLLGEGLPELPLEQDTNPYLFFSIGATQNSLSELGVQRYEESADAIAHAVFDDAMRRLELVGCEPTAPGDACVEDFLIDFGRRAFRRPLTPQEQNRWLSVATDLAEGDPWRGLRLAVSGILQSPYFLYRVELGEPDPDDPSVLRYTGFEMASRLSYLLWNTTPDDELLDAAEAGELDGTQGVQAQAQRLLDDPRARDAVQDFFAQYFDLGRLGGVHRDPERYPLFTPSLPESMRTEIRLLIDDYVFRREADIRQVFSSRRTFVNADLAALYGLDVPQATDITFVPIELPEDGPRAGLLTLGAFLAMNAHETETSPTLRGKYVRERVLCQTVPPPPDEVDTNVDPDDGEGETLRERLERHRDDPACSGCHAFIDPPGFLFENFDSVGAYRTQENGHPIDATGDLDGTPLQNARDLADVLAQDDRVGRCVVTQLFRHGHGRLETDDEEPALDDLQARFADADYRFRELVLELVVHPSFRTVTAQTEGE